MAQFKDVVTDRKAFREIMGEPHPAIADKAIDHLDRHCGAFIAKAPFIIIASSGGDGCIDVSPKGDPCGFVKVIDDKTLAIPDRPGNRRADTIENLFDDPHIGLIFLIPGKTETLRVSGTAQIVRDQDLRDSMAVNGKSPDFAIAVHVEEAMFHCSKCMIRSKLWQPDHWPSLEGLPRLAETMADAGSLGLTADQIHEFVKADERDRLY